MDQRHEAVADQAGGCRSEAGSDKFFSGHKHGDGIKHRKGLDKDRREVRYRLQASDDGHSR